MQEQTEDFMLPATRVVRAAWPGEVSSNLDGEEVMQEWRSSVSVGLKEPMLQVPGGKMGSEEELMLPWRQAQKNILECMHVWAVAWTGQNCMARRDLQKRGSVLVGMKEPKT